MKFLFDLDGTVTSQETLPVIANHFDISKEMEELTRQTVQGNIPFVESFIRRVNILGTLPVSEVDDLLGQVPLYPLVHQFIKDHPENCAVVTGNLDCWCRQLNSKVGCQAFCSHAIV